MGSRAQLRQALGVLVVLLALLVDLLLWGNQSQLGTGDTLPTVVIPALTAAVYSLLLLRWRWPVAVFVVLWVYSLAGLVLRGYAPFAGLLVGLHAVACRTSRRTAVLALLSCTVPFAIDSYHSAAQRSHLETNFWVSFAVQLSLYLLFSVTVWGFGRYAYAAARRSEQMQQQHAEAAARALQVHQQEANSAVRAERLRLARELHDIVGDGVTAMYMQAAGARTLLVTHDEHVRESLSLIVDTGVRTMGELHRMLGLLRAASPQDTRDDFVQPPTLRNNIDELVTLARASGVSVALTVAGAPVELDRSLDMAAFRIVQESLTNTAKHAGRGASAHVDIVWENQVLSITVRDRRGLEPPQEAAPLSSGYGLLGLEERVKLLGGRLETAPVSQGFLVRAELPIGVPNPAESIHAPMPGEL